MSFMMERVKAQLMSKSCSYFSIKDGKDSAKDLN